MKLKERLKQLDEETVYLGCKNGSSWIFIGHASELKEKLTEIEVLMVNEKISNLRNAAEKIAKYPEHKLTLSASLERAEAKLAKLESELQIEVDDEKVKFLEIEHKDAKAKRNSLKASLAHLEKSYPTAKKTRKLICQQILNWAPLSDREIIEEYQHEYETPGISLLVDGDSLGKYWTYEEYLKDNKKRRKTKCAATSAQETEFATD